MSMRSASVVSQIVEAPPEGGGGSEGEGAPADIDMRVVVHVLGRLRHLGDVVDPPEEGLGLHLRNEGISLLLPTRMRQA
jgi:hypothetical protein